MNIVFRTDASLQIGTGHVMRCLTLADALQANGYQCSFVCREFPGNLIAQIRQRGFSVCALPAPNEVTIENEESLDVKQNYAAWLGQDWATDASQTAKCVGGKWVDWLIVDHYAIDMQWEQLLRNICCKLMVIDDLANRPHDCDLLLDQNLGRDSNDYCRLLPKDCVVLAGPMFALLGSDFTAFREASLRHRAPPKLRHLLITMGGVDQVDATGKVLEALQECPLPVDMHITVVMGPHAPWLERVQKLAKHMMWPTEVKINVKNMAQLMSESDLAIGAGGSTSWERCCLGLPTVLVVLAENQRKGAAALERSGSVMLINSIEKISNSLRILLGLITTKSLLRLSQNCLLITDGRGAHRVIDNLNNRYA
jgi:UDP-2,4-diacetamido-2,4,6-trideoxy-beta-L-altropyranose hydrolase